MKPSQATRRFPLHIHITTLFLVLTLLVGGIIAGIGFKLSRDMLEATAADLINRVGRETGKELTALIEPAELATSAGQGTGRALRLPARWRAQCHHARISPGPVVTFVNQVPCESFLAS
ncbi:MAG: hypothetical protein PSV24_06165 [Rhodoferax sp.]|nr:hypothetical protein [Rhodoferax sp.]